MRTCSASAGDNPVEAGAPVSSLSIEEPPTNSPSRRSPVPAKQDETLLSFSSEGSREGAPDRHGLIGPGPLGFKEKIPDSGHLPDHACTERGPRFTCGIFVFPDHAYYLPQTLCAQAYPC